MFRVNTKITILSKLRQPRDEGHAFCAPSGSQFRYSYHNSKQVNRSNLKANLLRHNILHRNIRRS